MASNDKLHVHNAEWYKDCMESADWTPSFSPPKHIPKLSPGHVSLKERQIKQREAFLQKQSVREHEVKQRFEIVKRDAERRTRERAIQREQEFEDKFVKFRAQNETLVEAADQAIKADEAWRTRKKERLYNEWSQKIFEPMQSDINAQLNALSREDLEGKRRHMLQCFLEESNRKANGLFRDIIIESDYDPLAQARAATISFKCPSIADDPTKNRATREMGDRLASGLGSLMRTKERRKQPLPKNGIPVTMWNRMEATPYGRYSDEPSDRPPRKPDFLKSAVHMNHYDVASGRDAERAIRSENGLRGKKMVPPCQLPSIKECFTCQ